MSGWERAEARRARAVDPPLPVDPPSFDDPPPHRGGHNNHEGRCGGCGQAVSSRDSGGACLFRGGVWHPACREQARR